MIRHLFLLSFIDIRAHQFSTIVMISLSSFLVCTNPHRSSAKTKIWNFLLSSCVRSFMKMLKNVGDVIPPWMTPRLICDLSLELEIEV